MSEPARGRGELATSRTLTEAVFFDGLAAVWADSKMVEVTGDPAEHVLFGPGAVIPVGGPPDLWEMGALADAIEWEWPREA